MMLVIGMVAVGSVLACRKRGRKQRPSAMVNNIKHTSLFQPTKAKQSKAKEFDVLKQHVSLHFKVKLWQLANKLVA
jgi:hypothetical protein